MIDTVVFDFGNVIFSYDRTPFINKLVDSSPKSEEEIRESFLDNGLEDEFSKGELNTDEFFKKAKRLYELDISKEEFIVTYADIFDPNREVMNLIKNLSGVYKLQLFSDTNPIHYKTYIENCPVYSLFDAETISFRIGSLKTSKKGYKDVIRKSGSKPEDIVFIDDFEDHVEISRNLGIKGIHFKGYEQLKRKLKDLGVDF